MKYLISTFITFSLLIGAANIKSKKIKQNFFQKRLNSLSKGFLKVPLPGNKELNFYLGKNSIADEVDCDAILDKIEEDTPNYEAGALSNFNGVLYYLNNRSSGDVENVLCHFKYTMGMKGVVGEDETIEYEVEEDGEKMTMYINVKVEEPTEPFATDNNYTKRATVSISEDNVTFNPYMRLWYGNADGSESTTTTGGFMTEGLPLTLGTARASYFQWDLRTENQIARFFAAEFNSAEEDGADRSSVTPDAYFLKDSESSYSSDSVAYGRFSLNDDTEVINVQGIIIEGDRRAGSPSLGYGCYKMFGTGTKTGQLVVAKTRDDYCTDPADPATCDGYSIEGHMTDVTSSGAKSTHGLDAACMLDDTSTPNFVGNLDDGDVDNWETKLITAINTSSSNSIDDTTAIFDFSCDELAALNTAGGVASGYAFSSDHSTAWVDFSASPEDVFGTTLDAVDDNDVTAPTREDLCSDVNTEKIDSVTGCYCPDLEEE